MRKKEINRHTTDRTIFYYRRAVERQRKQLPQGKKADPESRWDPLRVSQATVIMTSSLLKDSSDGLQGKAPSCVLGIPIKMMWICQIKYTYLKYETVSGYGCVSKKL